MKIIWYDEMDTFTIQLNDGTIIEFLTEDWVQLFPFSVITSILTQDPTTTTIHIQEPSVTLGILNFLHQIIISKMLPSLIPRQEPLASAGRYLGIDLLGVVGDPAYDRVMAVKPTFNIFDWEVMEQATQIPSDYRDLISFAIQAHFPNLASLVFRRVPPSLTREIDLKFLVDAVKQNDAPIVDLLLRRGVDPVLAEKELPDKTNGMTGFKLLTYAITKGKSNVASALLQAPTIDFHSDVQGYIINLATKDQEWDLVADLLVRSDISLAVSGDEVMRNLIAEDQFVLLGAVIQHPTITTAQIDQIFLEALSNNQPRVMAVLATAPKASLRLRNTYRLYRAILGQNPDGITALLALLQSSNENWL